MSIHILSVTFTLECPTDSVPARCQIVAGLAANAEPKFVSTENEDFGLLHNGNHKNGDDDAVAGFVAEILGLPCDQILNQKMTGIAALVERFYIILPSLI